VAPLSNVRLCNRKRHPVVVVVIVGETTAVLRVGVVRHSNGELVRTERHGRLSAHVHWPWQRQLTAVRTRSTSVDDRFDSVEPDARHVDFKHRRRLVAAC
jgi:hypothetical protein